MLKRTESHLARLQAFPTPLPSCWQGAEPIGVEGKQKHIRLLPREGHLGQQEPNVHPTSLGTKQAEASAQRSAAQTQGRAFQRLYLVPSQATGSTQTLAIVQLSPKGLQAELDRPGQARQDLPCLQQLRCFSAQSRGSGEGTPGTLPTAHITRKPWRATAGSGHRTLQKADALWRLGRENIPPSLASPCLSAASRGTKIQGQGYVF